MLRQYKFRFYNIRLVLMILLISMIGVSLVGDAAADLQFKQLAGVIFAFAVMLTVSLIDYSWICNFSWIMYVFNIILLLAVRLFGDEAGGAGRWLDLGFVRFQPTELSKIIIIVFFARYFMDHEDEINTVKTIVKSVFFLGISLILIYSQPDLKNTITVTVVFCALIYIAGLHYRVIFGIMAIVFPLLIIFLSIVVKPDQTLIADYQRDRIMSFLYPDDDQYSDGIQQQLNSVMAIGSGELSGKVLSGEDRTYVNEGNFVAENQTDFIFAVAGEEYGFIGCTFIVVLLLLITIECIRMSMRAKDLAGKVICCGVATVIGLQSFINICVATRMMPNTGTPLPFVSYGLTSLVSLYIGVGMVLNVGLQASAYHKELKRMEKSWKEELL